MSRFVKHNTNYMIVPNNSPTKHMFFGISKVMVIKRLKYCHLKLVGTLTKSNKKITIVLS